MVGSFGLEIIYEYNDYLTLGRKATMLSGSFAGFNELTEFTVICKMKLRRERERGSGRESERESGLHRTYSFIIGIFVLGNKIYLEIFMHAIHILGSVDLSNRT